MGFFGWIKGLTSAAAVVEANADIPRMATKGLFDAVDALVFTEEERVHENQKSMELTRKFWEQFAHENSEQSKARRELAFMIMKSFFLMLFMAIAARGFEIGFGVVNHPLSTFIIEVVKVYVFLVTAIGLTYFVPHQVSKVFTYKKENKG